ncbi:hypothetical protein ACIP88_11485 [Streptomyces uncialis]|uniref:hypothetical protein n=1 Tax=Streptomyces uncialis TaxID=1048205 RepID=UPI0038278020
MTHVGLFHSVLGLRDAGHFCTDPGSPDHNAAAAELTWARVVDFLDRHDPRPAPDVRP